MSDNTPAPERIAPDFSGNDEFQRAVNDAVAARLEALLPALDARFAKAREQSGGPAPSDNSDGNFVQSLALQLAELTGQGTGRIYVAPEVVEHRRQSHERMVDILLELRAARQVPAYRLRNKVFLNLGPRMGEVLIDPVYRDNAKIMQTQEIDWPGVPNLSMEPINEAAGRVFAAFCDSIGHNGGAVGPDRLFVLSSDGAVLRGDMAAILKAREWGDPDGTEASLPAATLRRDDPAPKKKVAVLGTLAPMVEVS